MSTNVKGQATEETRVPNVRLAAGQQPIAVDAQVNIGGTPGMDLPSEAEQRRGFWVSHPEILIRQYTPRYKYVRGRVAFAPIGAPATARIVPTIEVAQTKTGSDNPVVERLAGQADNDPEFQKNGGVTQNGNT